MAEKKEKKTGKGIKRNNNNRSSNNINNSFNG